MKLGCLGISIYNCKKKSLQGLPPYVSHTNEVEKKFNSFEIRRRDYTSRLAIIYNVFLVVYLCILYIIVLFDIC
jgi:hypothetical protein